MEAHHTLYEVFQCEVLVEEKGRDQAAWLYYVPILP